MDKIKLKYKGVAIYNDLLGYVYRKTCSCAMFHKLDHDRFTYSLAFAFDTGSKQVC